MNIDGSNMYITYELPGINKNDIDLKVSDQNVVLNVSGGSRKYYKEIESEHKLKAESTEAKFTNGILDVKIALDKADDQK